MARSSHFFSNKMSCAGKLKASIANDMSVLLLVKALNFLTVTISLNLLYIFLNWHVIWFQTRLSKDQDCVRTCFFLLIVSYRIGQWGRWLHILREVVRAYHLETNGRNCSILKKSHYCYWLVHSSSNHMIRYLAMMEFIFYLPNHIKFYPTSYI